MNTERELTNDELDVVSGGAGTQPCDLTQFACAFLSAVGVLPTGGGSGGGLVHEPIHAN